MILYDLTCANEHAFESWFRNSGAVEKLIKAGAVVCPECGSKKVHKAPMAPRIAKGSLGEKDVPAKAPNKDVAGAMEKAAAAFAELREAIEKNFDNVGEKFPEEARKIHYGEAEPRSIYGDASKEEAEKLVEEGIEVYAIPWKKRRTNA